MFKLNRVHRLLIGLSIFFMWSSSYAVELTHWPEKQAEELNNLIKLNANKGEFAVFDMDNTTYKNDLEESLIPYLENKGILNRESIDPSLKLIPFIDSLGKPESLYSYYHRLCEVDDLICYPWAAQVFSGLKIKDLNKYVDELMLQQELIPVEYVKNNKLVKGQVEPPKPMRGMQELFNKLHDNGIEVYIMSAAHEELVRMVASDPKYGYNVKPQNVIGVNTLLKNTKTGEYTTARKQIKSGKYDPVKNKDLEITSYIVNPMTWFEGKAGTILGYIDQWRKPILVGGDTVYSDTYMLLNSVDIDKSGIRLWINRNPATLKKLEDLQQENVKKQTQAGKVADADKNWVVVTQQEIQ